LIALVFLATVIVLGESIASLISEQRYVSLIEDSLVIGSWVALWRPLEIFLYDWWPIRAKAKLFDRLSVMQVRTVNAAGERERRRIFGMSPGPPPAPAHPSASPWVRAMWRGIAFFLLWLLLLQSAETGRSRGWLARLRRATWVSLRLMPPSSGACNSAGC
jgi:hypothetical protein